MSQWSRPDVNNETVPGNADLEGAEVGDGSSTNTRRPATPGLGFLAVTGLLGLAVMVRRRF